MDVTKLKAALKNLNDELSNTIDGVVKARQTKGLRALVAAGQNIEKAEKLVDAAVAQAAPKAA